VPLWAGRRGDPHGRDPDPGLLELTVADVFRALADLDAEEATFAGTTPSSPEPLVARTFLQLLKKRISAAATDVMH